jgi:effector-binding domain-containing protein
MEAAYDAIDAYKKEHHLNERFGHIEEYVTDPASVNNDYKKVLTKIYLPIK